MNPARLLVFAGLTVALALSLSSSALVDACGIASRKGIRVAIADESAIIIWDEAARTQHFIRRASFQTAGEDFGFLVPTPTQPELAEASDASFKELEQLFSKFGRVAPAGKKGGG